jgi:hypothetical protein
VEGQAGQAPAEGPGRALDGQVLEGEGAAGRNEAAGRHCHSCLRLPQNHLSIDRRFGLIREWQATDAAAYEGARLREGLLDKSNTASQVRADTAYRSKANEAFMEQNGFLRWTRKTKPFCL